MGLIFCAIAMALTVVFFLLWSSVSKSRKLPALDKKGRGDFYAKVTALVVVGLSIAACSTLSVIFLVM